MQSQGTSAMPQAAIEERASRVASEFEDRLRRVYAARDGVFAWLMGLQWFFGIGVAVWVAPRAWSGRGVASESLVVQAILIGAALSIPPMVLARMRPGWVVTRHTVAVSQMLWSGLLVHLTGGRPEAHFHVFGSLAFLAFYRDWKVLATGTLVVLADHLVRGMWWPISVYGVVHPEWWRSLVHGFWILFEDTVLLMGIAENRREMMALVSHQAVLEELYTDVESKVHERTLELETSREQFRSLVESTRAIPWQMSMPNRQFTYVGPQAVDLLGCPVEHWSEPGFATERVHPDDHRVLYAKLRDAFNARQDREFEFRLRREDCTWRWVRCLASWGESAEGPCLRGYLQDVTDRRQLETDLQQSQKLESVGRLASGIAHEINTPIQFVGDSIHFIREGIEALLKLAKQHREVRLSAGGGGIPAERVAELEQAEEEADVAYLEDRLPKAIERSTDGLERVAKLVRAMKEFAHPDATHQEPADLNRALQATLTIATNEYKYVAVLETDFGDLPPVVCHVNEVNQAFLNILVNASHAIADVVKGTDDKGVVRVKTRQEGDQAVIEISDTGGGIPEAVQSKIFDPFFTTKEVGRGTGQGLAISRSVIVEKHGGSLNFKTTRGSGTTFIIRLPIAGRVEPASDATSEAA